MKKLLALLLALMMLFSVVTVFAGCEDSSKKKSSSSSSDDEDKEDEEEDSEDEGEDDEDKDKDSGDEENDKDDENDKNDKNDEDEPNNVTRPEGEDEPDNATRPAEDEKPSVSVKEKDVLGAIQNYVDLVYNNDTSVLEDCFSEEMFENEMSYTNYTVEDIEALMNDSDFMEYYYENSYDYYQEECGEGYSVTVSDLEYETLNSKAEDKFAEELEWMDMYASKLTAAVYVTFTMTHSGAMNTYEYEYDGVVFCYNGQYYYSTFAYTIDGITGEESSYMSFPALRYVWNLYFEAAYNY